MKKIILLTVLFVFSIKVNAQTPIQEFNFNGTLTNTDNTISFSGIVKYVNDRNGIANNAIRVVNTPLEATISNLPLANRKRSISIWIKYNDLSTANYIWGYGSLTNAQYFGLLQQSTTTSKSDLNLAGWGPANDVIVTTTIAPDTWYNYTVTYDGLTSRIYRNGELIKSSISPRKLTSALVFGLGKMGNTISMNADLDDLKIYNTVLSAEEVNYLYKNSSILASNNHALVTTSTIDKSLESEKTVVKSKTAKVNHSKNNLVNNFKSLEVYSANGLKVLSGNGNEMDITALPEGTYLLKVTSSKLESITDELTANN